LAYTCSKEILLFLDQKFLRCFPVMGLVTIDYFAIYGQRDNDLQTEGRKMRSLTALNDLFRGANFEDLIGTTIVKIEGMTEGSDTVYFYLEGGRRFLMTHHQDCCEDVTIHDINGVVEDLLNSPITMALESSNEDTSADYGSATWTFYKLATIKGFVDIRWLGISNGYYSEGVCFEEIKGDK